MKLLATCTIALCCALPAQNIFPYKFHIDDLPNGLRLITIPTDFPNIVALHIIVATGSRNEVEEGKSGFAHFFEHMMFRGTKNYTSKQRAAMFKQAGADRNAYTTDDYTNYHTTFAKEDLGKILMLEADRFRYLSYGQKVFRTEAMAVFGEYNKNSANPVNKLFEVVQDTAFTTHTYKHTTMGFLPDIVKMPKQYKYSQEFFGRWYKPEYTTILVVGDVTRDKTLDIVTKNWGDWERGSYKQEIPKEPPQQKPLTVHIPWRSPTQPWILVAFKGPAFDPDDATMPTLDVLSSLAFSENSDLYKKLFVRERKVNSLWSYFPDHKDPYLLMIAARVKEPSDVANVRDEILKTCARFREELVEDKRLAKVKANLKYEFAGGLDSSEAIAEALSGYIARTRTPEAVNKVYRHYDSVTPAKIRDAADKFFVASSRTIATLSHEPLPKMDDPVDVTPTTKLDSTGGPLLATNSPLISLRIQFTLGAKDDPKGKAGLTNITAQMLVDASTKKRSYEQIVEDMFPMAAGVGARVDKEFTTFSGTVHRDNLEGYYALLKEMLLEPGFKQSDLDRIKSNTISYLDVGLRRTNDEETGKEVMYQEIYHGHPYGHPNAGLIESIRSITLENVKDHYNVLRNSRRTIGLAGGFSRHFVKRIYTDLEKLSKRQFSLVLTTGRPTPIPHNRMTIVKKKTRATGIHIGFPIDVPRGHPDWPALWLVRSYFGEHRSENSYLYQRLREIRGLNYGDYAYIEYFPNGGSQFHPPANVARPRQIFQIWIRPVPPKNALFAFRAANYELRKLIENGITQENFEATRTYLSKFANLLVKTQDRQLGYALDSQFYRTPEFTKYVKEGLAKLTLEDINKAIKTHLRADKLQYVIVTEDAEGFRDKLISGDPTPITYQAEPAQEILDEDKIIEKLKIDLSKEHIKIVPIDQVFQK